MQYRHRYHFCDYCFSYVHLHNGNKIGCNIYEVAKVPTFGGFGNQGCFIRKRTHPLLRHKARTPSNCRLRFPCDSTEISTRPSCLTIFVSCGWFQKSFITCALSVHVFVQKLFIPSSRALTPLAVCDGTSSELSAVMVDRVCKAIGSLLSLKSSMKHVRSLLLLLLLFCRQHEYLRGYSVLGGLPTFAI